MTGDHPSGLGAGISRSASAELGRFGIRVNAVMAGVIATPMPDKRLSDAAREAAEQRQIATPTHQEGAP